MVDALAKQEEETKAAEEAKEAALAKAGSGFAKRRGKGSFRKKAAVEEDE